ncbi:MAG: HepT-like ribonuclease domain-containing protein [Bdellovibrionota bacterium]
MISAIEESRVFLKGKTRQSLNRSRMLALAVTKEMEIVGEAASKISEEFRERYPEIPWLRIVSMRNRLIHGYFDIELDIVWNTVTKVLPPLLKSLLRIQAQESK